MEPSREPYSPTGAERPRSAWFGVLLTVLGVAIGVALAAAGWQMFGEPRILGGARGVPAPAAAPPPAGASGGQGSAEGSALPLQGQDFTAKLRENGASACAAQLNAVALATNAGAAQFNTVSTWAMSATEKRLVSVAIAQKYPDGAPVPYAATAVVAAPNPLGPCDALAVQVVPSPLPCSKVRETLAGTSRQMSDLVGVALMGDPDGQTMLVPTAGNACVLIGVRAAYAK